MSGTLTQALRTTPRKKWVKRSLIALLIIILALLLGVGFYIWSIGHTWDSQTQKFDSITDSQDGLDNPPAAPTFTGPEGKDPKSLASEKDQNGDGILDTVEGGKTRDIVDSPGTDILLLGSDSRAGSADAAKVSGQRADTIMLMHIPKDGSGVYLISIMRDSWVNIPGYGSAKVNAALNYGGIGLQVATIEQLLGIKIDHVAEIDFTGCGRTPPAPCTWTAVRRWRSCVNATLSLPVTTSVYATSAPTCGACTTPLKLRGR